MYQALTWSPNLLTVRSSKGAAVSQLVIRGQQVAEAVSTLAGAALGAHGAWPGDSIRPVFADWRVWVSVEKLGSLSQRTFYRVLLCFMGETSSGSNRAGATRLNSITWLSWF